MIRNATECLEKCPEECDQIEFKVFQHFSHYPNDAYASSKLKTQTLLLANNLSVDEIKQSVAMLNINYQSMVTSVIQEVPAMLFPELLSNLGGQLGLFLGISLLSFVELLEFGFVLVWDFFHQTRKITNSD